MKHARLLLLALSLSMSVGCSRTQPPESHEHRTHSDHGGAQSGLDATAENDPPPPTAVHHPEPVTEPPKADATPKPEIVPDAQVPGTETTKRSRTTRVVAKAPASSAKQDEKSSNTEAKEPELPPDDAKPHDGHVEHGSSSHHH
jgi:outer membrane biosynthesis protein TonB